MALSVNSICSLERPLQSRLSGLMIYIGKVRRDLDIRLTGFATLRSWLGGWPGVRIFLDTHDLAIDCELVAEISWWRSRDLRAWISCWLPFEQGLLYLRLDEGYTAFLFFSDHRY